ncbi:ABC transporter substrate-binding protein [Sphaerimonospora cavernae]|uniref:ABC transporter substrate-binding protein n=1 Tax=Sphaerimonospora cavernae TaxID=1740611 RepID=A0ABV6TZW9_9ACTN
MRSHIPLRSRITAALLASCLIVTGCANSSSKNEGVDRGGSTGSSEGPSKAEIYTTGLVNADDAGTPVKGGTLTVAEYAEARSLNPVETYANGATGGSAMAAVYDELMRYDYKTDSFEPWLAESLTSDDNVTWTLKLRDGVKFTDGTPLNAKAVVGSIGFYQKNYAYNALLLLGNIAEMKATDDLTVVFEARAPWAKFPNMLAQGPGMIMAPAAYKDPKNFKPIGAGPFMLDHYSPGEELVLKANPGYWNGAPNLDALRFVWVGGADDTAKLDSLKNGDVDAVFMRDATAVEEARRAGYPGMMFVTGMGGNLWINVRKGRPGADVRVRQAIDYAFDPKAYMDRLDEGAGLPAKALLPETSPWHTGVEPNKADPEKAKSLLQAAMADGFDGEISYSHSTDASSQAAAVAIKAVLEAVGFKVTLVPLRTVADQVQKLYVDHDYDLAVAGTTIPDEDPYSRLSGVLGSESPSNTSGYSNPEMDKLLGELQAAPGPKDGKAVLAKIEELWKKEVPGIGIEIGGTFQAWQKNVHGLIPTSETMFLYSKAWKSE